MTSWFVKPRPKKMAAVGRVAKREGQYRAEWDLIVKRRCAGSCERCGSRADGLQKHHIFGRTGSGAGLGFPWAHLPEMMAAICPPCHELVTSVRKDDTLATTADGQLKRLAIDRFVVRGIHEGWLWGDEVVADIEQPIGEIRQWVAAAAANGGRDVVLGINQQEGNQ